GDAGTTVATPERLSGRAAAGRRGGGREAGAASRRPADAGAARHGAPRLPATLLPATARYEAKPGERAGVLYRLAGGNDRGRYLRGCCPPQQPERNGVSALTQRTHLRSELLPTLTS